MEIVWTQTALNSLDAMLDYIQIHWNKEILEKFLDDIDKGIELIQAHNDVGILYKDNSRQLAISKKAWLFYEIKNNTLIIKLIHSPRDNPNRLEILFTHP